MNNPSKNPLYIRRYGKPAADVSQIRDFIGDNSDWLENRKGLDALYQKQQRRTACKVCVNDLPITVLFRNNGTNYYLCERCGHLNGEFADLKAYSEEMYTTGIFGGDYREPTEEQFYRRMDGIYVPKARFLKNSLETLGVQVATLHYLDVGAGAGYMVGALHRTGLKAKGVDVDNFQVTYGNKMLNGFFLETRTISEITQIVRNTDAEVLTFIKVFEHIYNLREIFDAIKGNERIKYIFFCVPMMSLTCAIEVCFPEVFARQLGAGGVHNHLFSEESLAYIYEQYNFIPLAEWRFGQDIADIFRSISVMLSKNNTHEKFINIIKDFFYENTDSMQLIVDKAGLASEIHVLAQVH